MTNTRIISNRVYASVLATGLINGWRKTIYDYVWDNGPVTMKEALHDLNKTVGANTSTVGTRFSELVEMGAIEILCEILDPVDGVHHIALYDITGRLPEALKPQRKRETFWMVAFPQELSKAGRAFRVEKNAIAYSVSHPDGYLLKVIEVRQKRKRKP